MNSSIPKQYMQIHGKSILRHTLEVFLNIAEVASLGVIIDPEHSKWYHDTLTGLDTVQIIEGGKTRKSSVYNGLIRFSNLKDDDFILIHDAARPLVRKKEILALLDALKSHQAATLALPLNETLYRPDQTDYVDREGLWALQTPQAFHYGTILKAHENAQDKTYTDDTGLVAALGIPVKLVTGHRTNIKITTQDDMELARTLLSSGETRTGQGFDVHAFDKDSSGPVRLCGIDIPHDHALAGHSDADVGLHALTDALLGAIGAGDIGRHFPPSDPANKGLDSAVFLRKAIHLVSEAGGRITNIDLTIICEAPKIGPYSEEMRMRIAEIAAIDKRRVSVKATTTERLGFTGRKEGIAAQALATIMVPSHE